MTSENPSVNPNQPNYPITDDIHCHPHHLPFYRAISWGAIFAGTFAAAGLQLLFTLLGSSIGLGVFEPMRDSDPIKNFGIGAAITWSICAFISLYFGGMVAGFFSNKANHKSGAMHGLVVWCVIMVASFGLVSLGVGLTAGGAVKIVGEGLGLGGKAVAGSAAEAGKEGLEKNKSEISSFLDEATSLTNSASTTPGNSVRSKREIGLALTKLFAPENENSFADNRTALINALGQYNGMSQEDATKTVDEWIASYNDLKAQLKAAKDAADRKAREAAEVAAHNLAWASAVSFVAFLIGLGITICGGKCGACCACRACKDDLSKENYSRV
jgi:hypothetical protein